MKAVYPPVVSEVKSSNPYLPYPTIIEQITVENETADLRTFRLRFRDPDDRARFAFRVGQFAEVSLSGVGEAPFGIASSPLDESYVEFTVKRYPHGLLSSALHQCDVGASVGVRGPLGNGYPLEKMQGRNVVVIGGGFAVTTLRATLRYLLHETIRGSVGDITVIYGARNAGELCFKRDFQEWEKRDDIRVYLTVDRADPGWKGREGLVPQVVAGVAPKSSHAVCLVCGPPIMVKFTLPVLSKLGFAPADIFVSLEMRMKCGIGKCGRCNIGDRYVCVHGPVFSLAELNQLPSEY